MTVAKVQHNHFLPTQIARIAKKMAIVEVAH
jgi:hypothetical protein